MRSFGFVLALLVAVALIPVGIWYEWVYPSQAIEADLAADGITDVKTSYRMFSGTIFTRCNHEHATIRSFTGLKDGHYVEGLACYAPFWGATHWTS